MRNSVFATCQSPWFNMACCCPSSPAAYTKSTPGRADFECCVHSLLILLPLKSMFARWKWTRASKPIQIDLTRDRYTPFMALSCLTEDPSIGFFFFLISALMSFQGYIGLQRSLCQFHYCFEPRSAFTILYLTLLLVLMLFQVKMTHCIFESEVLENKCSVINAFSFSHSHTCIHIHPASYCNNSAVWIRSSIHKAASLSVSFQPLSKGYSGIRERLAVCSDFYAMQRSLPYKRTKRLLH